jgi:hypothetical protein
MNIYTKALLLLFAFTFLSCDKDYNTIGSDIIGDEHFDFNKYPVENLVSYLKETGPVQSNNLPINALGIYKDPIFGTTKSHFVSQIEMISSNPDVGYDSYIDNQLDSVYVYVPFFSTLETTLEDGSQIYKIDSIYGDSESRFKLNVYENGYTLRDFDPENNNSTTQKYYSDFKSTIVANKGSELLNNSINANENTNFLFDKREIVIYKTNGVGVILNSSGEPALLPDEYVVKERKAPGVWLNLKKSFFQTKILDAVGQGKLFNNNVFKQYFKGLYFEAEELIPGQGSMVNLDFTKAELVMQYHYYADKDSNGVPIDLKKSSIKFQMGYAPSQTPSKHSNSINLFEFSAESNYQNALLGNSFEGSLFLKGGANSSVVYLDVFNENELLFLKEKNWLINEAFLEFYVDQSQMAASEYDLQRIYLYDATNDKPLLDYSSYPTIGSSSKGDKYLFGGILTEENGGRKKYKIRITDHINNVLNSTDIDKNVRLGLVVTESINIASKAYLKTPIGVNGQQIKYVPVASVLNHHGTILYGPQSTATYVDSSGNEVPLKLKLQIYYTEPK